MERYLVFGGEVYYPAGGWEDFMGDYADLEEAKQVAEKQGLYKWSHVVDTHSQEIVFSVYENESVWEGRERVVKET